MRSLRLAVFGFILLFSSSFPQLDLAAKDADVSVKAEVDRAFITIGDPVEYTVTVRHDPSVEILSEIPPPSADILKIKKIEEFKREESGMKVRGRKFQLTAFRLGEFILGPVQIEYRVGGGPTQKIETNRIYLTVKSVAEGEEKTDIRDIKSVVSIPKKILGWILLLAGLGLLPLGFFLYRRLRKGPLAAQSPETVLTAEEEALIRLNQLFESDLLRKGKVKEYYLLLSEILRVYFEKRFGILAVEFTTHEILRSLKHKEIPSALLKKIEEVLEAADLAKFAKWKPEPAQIIQLNQKSRQIVEEAKPTLQEAEHGV